MKKHLGVLLILAAWPWTGLIAQQPPSATFKVKARVNAACDIVASDLDFGAYSSQSGSPLQGTTLLRTTCTPSASYQIGLNEGSSQGATVNQRRMVTTPAGVLNYQLYSNSARTAIWGNTPGSNTVTGVGTGLPQDHTVYGSVPAAQVVPVGDYTDTITVRIYF